MWPASASAAASGSAIVKVSAGLLRAAWPRRDMCRPGERGGGRRTIECHHLIAAIDSPETTFGHYCCFRCSS